MDSGSFSKKKLKILGLVISFLFLSFLLIDNLTFIKNVANKNLLDYAQANIKLENMLPDQGEPKFILEEGLDFGKITVFKTDSSYVVSLFRKGRISNYYNLENKFLLNIDDLKGEEYFIFNDSVYTYNFSLTIEGDMVNFKLISKDLDFDYSSIILLAIAFLVLLFLWSQNNKYMEDHKYKNKKDISKI